MKNNKKVLILGASSDIGLSIMRAYKKNNYNILAHFNKGNKKFFKFTKENEIETLKFNFLKSNKKIEQFLKNKKLKKSDILINALGSITNKTFLETKAHDLEKIFKVNFYPSMILTRNLGIEMNKKKWGRIVNLGSIGVKFGGGINNFPYAISKFLLEFFPNQTTHWVKNNVLINTVRVGATNTKLHLKLPSKNLKKRASLIPMKRLATTNEIADFIFFLGSDQNTYISNQVLSISGGE